MTERFAAVRARLQKEAPDEQLLWIDKAGLSDIFVLIMALGLIALFLIGFGSAWNAWGKMMLEGADKAPWVMKFGIEYIVGAGWYLIPLGYLVLAVGPLVLVMQLFQCYAISEKSAWMILRNGRGTAWRYALSNVGSVDLHGMNTKGVADIELKFITPVQRGKMQKKSIRFCGVRDALNVQEMLLAHLTAT